MSLFNTVNTFKYAHACNYKFCKYIVVVKYFDISDERGREYRYLTTRLQGMKS